MALRWLPIAGTLCGFRGNPSPGSTERAVCVAYIAPNLDPMLPGECWRALLTPDGLMAMGLEASLESAKRAAEAAVGDEQ